MVISLLRQRWPETPGSVSPYAAARAQHGRLRRGSRGAAAVWCLILKFDFDFDFNFDFDFDLNVYLIYFGVTSLEVKLESELMNSLCLLQNLPGKNYFEFDN